MRTKDSIIEEIIQFFKDNKSVFNTAIEELDDCNENGYLGDTRCRSSKMRSKEDVINIIRSYCLANDGDEATTDLLLAIGAEILGVSAEETQKMLAWSGREPDVPDQEGGHEQDRFTKRLSDGQAVMDCQKCEADWTAKHGKPLVQCTALYCRNRCKDRLADYEDAEDALKKSGGHNLYPHA